MGRRRGRGGANGAEAAGAARDEEAAAAAPTTHSSLETRLLVEEEEETQPLAPPLPRPRTGSSSSCFLADGILAAADADNVNGEIGERRRVTGGGGGGGSASTSGAAAAAASGQELARATHAKTQKRLAVAVALASGFMVAEVVGGALANSLAIMSDAAHLLSDVAGMVS